jgi:hypothetical protein
MRPNSAFAIADFDAGATRFRRTGNLARRPPGDGQECPSYVCLRLGRAVLVAIVSAALVAGSIRQAAAGDRPSAGRRTTRQECAVQELPAFTPQREAAALAFVAEHHSQLREVLGRLKSLDRGQYEQAIRELFQAAEKLRLVKDKDAELHALMLEAWKVNSRIEVLASRIMSAQEAAGELEAELKELLYRQVDLQRQQVEHNRKRLLAALEGMEANIRWLKENRETFVARRFRNLTQVTPKTAAKRPQQPAPPGAKKSGSADSSGQK